MQKRLCSKLGIALIIVGSITVLSAAAVLAASSSQLDLSTPVAPSDDVNAATLWASGGNIITDSIALFFGVDVTDVVELRSEGFGFGEIAKVYFLGARAVTDTTSILALRQSGMGWGQIAKFLGLHPGNRGNNLGMIVSGRGTLSDTLSAGAGVSPTVSMAGSNIIADVITKTFGTDIISYTTIISLRTGTYEVGGQPITRSFGWGQIFKLGWLANTYSGTVSLDQLVISRTQEHMGWGKILHALGLEHGFGRVAKSNDDLPRNLGQAKKSAREGDNVPTAGEAENTSVASPAPGNQGNGNQGNGNQGNGNQGKGNQGNGNQGNGNQGKGNQGNGNQGKGNQGKGNQGKGNQGKGGGKKN